jgi:DNA-binding HxlR family transcriptional regulator
MFELKSSDLICPFTTAQKVLSGKWSLMIIFLLKDGPIRFNELLRKFDGLTHASLTKQLRQLESFRLIHREVYNQVPPKVEYSLTDLGKKLYPTINGLTDWGTEYIEDCKITEASSLG